MAILILFGFSLHRLVVCNSQVNFQTQNNRTKFPSNIFDDLFLNIELFPYSATCGSSGSSNIVVNNQEVFCRAELCSIRKYPQSYDNFNIIADVISIGEKECVDPNFNETLRIVKPSNILTRKRNIFQSSGLCTIIMFNFITYYSCAVEICMVVIFGRLSYRTTNCILVASYYNLMC